MAIELETLKAAVTGSGITPEHPLPEAPPEVKGMTFSFDPDLMTGGDNTTIKTDKVADIKTDPPKIEETVKETPKVEDTPKVETPKPKEETVKSTEKTTPETTESKPTKKQFTPIKGAKTETADTFDYAKYAPHEVQNMKNMSRQSREAYAKLIDENKQLASLKDANYLQHERGYTLSPEYSDLVTKDRNARAEGQAWESALVNVMNGKPYREPVDIDANGNIVFGPERQATDRDQIRLQSNINICDNASRQHNAQLQQFPNQFKQRLTQDLSEIQNERSSRFAWVSDPKLLDHPVEIEGHGPQKVSEIRNNFKSLFPVYLRNTPGVEVAADLLVALQIQSAELREARSGKQVAEIKRAEAIRAEPSSDNVDNVKPNTKLNGRGIPTTFTLDGMPSR